MNFKDVMRRYKEGTATEEEKEFVEKELEKFATIEDYYAEELPDEFMSDRESENEEELVSSQSETTNINKIVNRRLGKVVLVSV